MSVRQHSCLIANEVSAVWSCVFSQDTDNALIDYHMLFGCRRPSIRSTAATLSTDGAASEAPTPSPRNRPNTAPSSPLARTGTTMTLQSPSLGKTLGRTTTAAFDPAFFGKTLGRSETNLTAAMFSKTLGRTSTNVVSYGKTLGRSGTMMSGMTMGRTMGREHGFGETMRHDFGATQAAAPPLAIDPLLTAMLQKAGTDMPQAKARATSPAFEVCLYILPVS